MTMIMGLGIGGGGGECYKYMVCVSLYNSFVMLILLL